MDALFRTWIVWIFSGARDYAGGLQQDWRDDQLIDIHISQACALKLYTYMGLLRSYSRF